MFVVILQFTCFNVLLYYLFMHFSVLSVLAFVSTVCQSYIVVILAKCVTLPCKREVWLAIKPDSIHFFFLKCPVPSQECGCCYQIVHFYACWRLFCCSCFLLIVDVFFFFSVCNLDLFSLNRFTTFKHQYTTVAFLQ